MSFDEAREAIAEAARIAMIAEAIVLLTFPVAIYFVGGGINDWMMGLQ
jgi:hypothetical protein